MDQVFPIGLEALRELSSEVAKYAVEGVGKNWKCHGCDASKPIDQMSRCGQCKVYSYCSKVCRRPKLLGSGLYTVSMDDTKNRIQDCQAKGWNEKGHKSSCKVLRGPNFLSLLKLDFSSGPASNPFTFQRH